MEKTGLVKLEDLLVIGRAQVIAKAVACQLKVLDGSSSNNEVNYVRKPGRQGKSKGQRNIGSGQGQGKTCFNCGCQGHFARDETCPAHGQVCKQCGEVGHFKVKCPKMSTGCRQDAVQHPKDKGNGFESRHRKNHEINLVSDDHRSDDLPAEQTKHEYVFAVKHDGMSAKGMVLLKVGRVEIPDVLIDSGATCNLMGRGTWEWLK